MFIKTGKQGPVFGGVMVVLLVMQTIAFDINRGHLPLLERQRNPKLNKKRCTKPGTKLRHQFIRLVIAYLETAIGHVPFSTLSQILVNLVRSGASCRQANVTFGMSGGGLGVNTLVMLDTVQDEETLFDSSIHFSNHFQLIFTYAIVVNRKMG